MRELFLRYLSAGAACGAFILLFWALSGRIDRRYAPRWKRLVWLAVSLRLTLPVELRLFRPRVVIPLETARTSGGEIVLHIEGAAHAAGQASAVSWLDALSFVWLAGAAVSLGVYAVSYIRFRRRAVREGAPVRDREIKALLRREGRALGMERLPRLLRWRGCRTPLAVGWLSPLLLLPEEDYTPSELRLLFRHELSHIRRGDLWLKGLLATARALHWYNPAVRLLPALADVDMELSCDDTVTRGATDTDRRAYSELLFRFARGQTIPRAGIPARVYTTNFYGGKETMKKRFRNIFSTGKKRGLTMLVTALGVLLALGSLVACGQSGTSPAAPSGPSASPAPTPVAEATPSPVPLETEAAPTPSPREVPEQEQEALGQELQETEEDLTDRKALEDMLKAFADAYFAGDRAGVESLLSAGFTGDSDLYEGGEVSEPTVQIFGEFTEAEEGEVCPVRITFVADGEDSYTYLSMEAVKENGVWKVQFYGLEK